MQQLSNGDWADKWKNKATHWHLKSVHPTLLKYIDELLFSFPADQYTFKDNQYGKKRIRVLVPLCGKSVDMLFLARDCNLDVVGIEYCDLGAKEFFAENNLEYKCDEIKEENNVWQLFQWVPREPNVLGSLKILISDFFRLPLDMPVTKFDLVWDRASLIAINVHQRNDYVAVIDCLMDRNKSAKILLVVIEIEKKDGGAELFGPPRMIKEGEVHRLYQNDFTIQRKDRNPMPLDERFTSRGITKIDEITYFLQRK